MRVGHLAVTGRFSFPFHSFSTRARIVSNSHFKRSPKKGDVEVEEAMVALSGIGRLDVEALEHETKQVIPVIKREVLDQGPQVLEESAP